MDPGTSSSDNAKFGVNAGAKEGESPVVAIREDDSGVPE